MTNFNKELVLQSGIPELVIIGSSHEHDRDGMKFAAQIRQHNRRIPIILLSRQSSEVRILAALRAGVTDYFKVPFSYDEILASIKQHKGIGCRVDPWKQLEVS